MKNKKDLSPPRGRVLIPPTKAHKSGKDYDRKKALKELFVPRYGFYEEGSDEDS